MERRKIILTIAGICILSAVGTGLLTFHKRSLPPPQIITTSETLPPSSPEPTLEASPSPSATTFDPQSIENSKTDLNIATADELDKLPGIGPVLAKRIIEYRTQSPFKTIYDLKKVSGIGDKKFETLKDKITVGS